MGLLLSKHGMGPTEENGRAMVEAGKLQTSSEVRSFFGLVGFSARFIPDFATSGDPLRRLCKVKRTVYVGYGARGYIPKTE